MPQNIYDNEGNKVGSIESAKETAIREAREADAAARALRKSMAETEKLRLAQLKIENPEAYQREMRSKQVKRQGVIGFALSGCLLGMAGANFVGLAFWSNGGILAVAWLFVTGWRMKREGLL